MKKSKLVSIIAGSTAAAVIGVSGISYAYAQEAANVKDTFVSILASKLGVSEDKVSAALEQTRIEMHNEREKEVDSLITQALKDGKLTQRQVDIINEMQEIREEKIKDGEKPERGNMKNELIAELKERGFKVTEDELAKLHTAMRDLGIGRENGKGNGLRLGR